MMPNMGAPAPALPGNWSEMTPQQKRQWRLDRAFSTEGINFVSPEAKKAYQVRSKRLIDVYNVQEPDRVPLSLPVGNLPFIMSGVNYRTAMYDYVQVVEACRKFNDKYSSSLEYYASPMSMPGKVMDLLDYRLYVWPGHGLALNSEVFQFKEGEYMKADEYNDFIRDPSDFWLRTFLPRIFGTFESFRMLQPLTDIIEINSMGQMGVLSNPQVQDTLLKMVEVGREYQRMMQVVGPFMEMGSASGFPVPMGFFAKAPFDTLGDTLRGTQGIMKDMYRQPDKVLEACDKIADLTIYSILKSPQNPTRFNILYPLHKGADGWMSQKQFETFYLPSFKKVMNALINEGLIQSLFAEGSFNTRMEYFTEFPEGSLSWMFDQTDMFRAKKILGDRFCIQGNVPASLIVTGSPHEVKESCRKLIEGCGKGGGYLLTVGCMAENPKLENLQAMVDAVNEYGYYRKS
jgi:uroporphyrinogen-III decarboxylase